MGHANMEYERARKPCGNGLKLGLSVKIHDFYNMHICVIYIICAMYTYICAHRYVFGYMCTYVQIFSNSIDRQSQETKAPLQL